jgi:hypothetical protein
MSELMNTGESRTGLLQRLLTTVSALSLLTMAVSRAQAEEADRPTVWIELGAQLERVDGGQQYFAPAFTDTFVSNGFTPVETVERAPRYSNGGEGKLSFAPEGSNWVFSASLRYGRSNAARVKHQETAPASAESILSVPLLGLYSKGVAAPLSRRFADFRTRTDESHAMMDFMVGRDVGLGLFGAFSQSQFDFGIRLAQFSSKSTATIGADPDFNFSYKYSTVLPPPLPPLSGHFKIPAQSWHLYDSQFEISRSFRGIGPSVGWDASATVLGNPHDTALTFDWGVNASVLFGRQKVKGHHQTTARYRPTDQGTANTLVPVYHHSYPTARSRSVTIPNVGGFAGLSVKFPNAKVSLGYRADVFFGAVDGGIDARKTYDRAFYGPFATISFGMGG